MATSQRTTPDLVISPAKLIVKEYPSRFNLTFTGLDSEGRRRSVRLRFPSWWTDVLVAKLRPLAKKRAGT